MLEMLLLAQGAYFVVTGLWPIVSIRTFQMVTGPKRDLWLVKTLGAVIAAIAIPLLIAGSRTAPGPEVLVLAILSALALMLVDVIYSLRRVISYIYLVDAGVEAALLAAYGVALAR
ncbi:MAG TPA: hypothetical protein VEJ63_05040 [Planctomycetota bacterium]|nr:hypothetical protein [Planctomycetota bacterium]